MQVIITVDTEADNQWEKPERITVENLRYVPRFQELCESYGMKPTYLCTYEIAEADTFGELVSYQKKGTAEIGSHLHPWSNPPFPDASIKDYDQGCYPAFPTELSLDDFRAKMSALTKVITQRCGRAPTSYRAGRWGFNSSHIDVLLELGYTVDCSISPLVSWTHQRGIAGPGPDFRNAPMHPYILDENDVCKEGHSGLVEIPVTIRYQNPVLRSSPGARRLVWSKRKSLLGRLIGKVVRLDPTWLRPYSDMSAQRLTAVVELAKQNQDTVVEMMLHSSELMPGCSPYNTDDAAIESLYQRMAQLFKHMASNGYKGCTLTEAADAFRPAPPGLKASAAKS